MSGYSADAVPRRDGGNTLIVGLILVTMISAFITAQVLVTQKNSRHSSFTNELHRLRHVAESGVQQSVYELGYGVGNGDGKIGTEFWTFRSDLGRDGRRETKDEGEWDGIPSPGEPDLSPRAVCAAKDGTQLFTYAVDSPWTDVKRIISTAASPCCTGMI